MKIFKNKKILVTGGSGFLGGYIVEELLKNGNDVTVLTNKKDETGLRVKLILADIKNREELVRKVKDFDIIYHVAGIIRTPETEIRELHFAINSEGTRNILEACRINEIKRFVFVSSVEVYGDKNKEGIKENEKKIPSNYYGESKLLAETYCREYAQKYAIVTTIVRPSYIYGYGQYRKRLFPKLINDAVERGKTDLKPHLAGNDYVYVKDVATAIILLGGRKQNSIFADYNISSGKFITINKVFKILKFLTGLEYEDSNIGKRSLKRISFSVEKAKRAGYRPRFSLKKGLADYINSKTNDSIIKARHYK